MRHRLQQPMRRRLLRQPMSRRPRHTSLRRPRRATIIAINRGSISSGGRLGGTEPAVNLVRRTCPEPGTRLVPFAKFGGFGGAAARRSSSRYASIAVLCSAMISLWVSASARPIGSARPSRLRSMMPSIHRCLACQLRTDRCGARSADARKWSGVPPNRLHPRHRAAPGRGWRDSRLIDSSTPSHTQPVR